MKKIVLVICLALATLFAFSIGAFAEDTDYSWFIIKKGNDAPAFGEQASMVADEGGYYIDKSASETGEKIIYLTFDAGYDNGNVKKTLDILKENNVKGAFFILSNILKKNPETVGQMFADGHLVCNHTKNHKNMSTLTDEEMKANLEALESLCLEQTGYCMMKYFRFPEGKYSERTMKNANRLGYKTFFWSLAYADWDNNVKRSKDAAINNLITNTHPGAIVLLHPTSDINVEILPELIKRWKSMGYTFGTLDELVSKNSQH